MKDTIARLRELETKVSWTEYAENVVDALPQLFDRLEKLEAVLESLEYQSVHDFEKPLEDALKALGWFEGKSEVGLALVALEDSK